MKKLLLLMLLAASSSCFAMDLDKKLNDTRLALKVGYKLYNFADLSHFKESTSSLALKKKWRTQHQLTTRFNNLVECIPKCQNISFDTISHALITARNIFSPIKEYPHSNSNISLRIYNPNYTKIIKILEKSYFNYINKNLTNHE